MEIGTSMVKVGGSVLKLQLWDTAGQENFKSMTSIFYRGASAAVLTYSVCNAASFAGIGSWMEDVTDKCDEGTEFFLVGN